jgi:hypothetical protein
MWGIVEVVRTLLSERPFAITLLILLTFLPLGIWKLVDIVIWLFSHVSISVN